MGRGNVDGFPQRDLKGQMHKTLAVFILIILSMFNPA